MIDLEHEMRAAFAQAKWWWRRILVLYVAAIILAGASQMLLTGKCIAAVSFTTMAVALVTIAMRWRAANCYSTGECLRRALLQLDALGDDGRSAELAQLRAKAPPRNDSEPLPLGSYFTSSAPIGWQRAVQHIHESAFYTQRLAHSTGMLCAWTVVAVVALTALAVVAGLNGAMSAESVESARRLANVGCTVVGVVAGGTFADLAHGYFSLARGAERSFELAGALRKDPRPKFRNVVELVSTYDAALAAACPLPTFIYKMRRNRLDALWKSVR